MYRTQYPKISIVTPSYNQAEYLEETIQSILGQAYPNLEYIIIEGGSSDGSVEIIEKYTSQLSCWVSEPDKGQSDAINKGFAKCTGDIITFCNSDDFYTPGTLMDVADQWQAKQNCGAIIGGFYYVDVHSQPTSGIRMPKLLVEAPVDLTTEPPGVYRLHQAATFFSRSALDSVGRYVRTDLKYVMDRELLYRVLRSFPVVLRERAYAAFRRHPESKSVADILPFAAEFAAIYDLLDDGDLEARRKRTKLAQHHYARGYIKLSQSPLPKSKRVGALLRALKHQPSYLLSKRYYIHWMRLIR